VGRLKIVVDFVRHLCYLATLVASTVRAVLPGILRVVHMVYRWRLWRGCRKRPKVTRQWLGSVRLDLEYGQHTGYRLVAWAVMEVRGEVRSASKVWSIDVPKKPGEHGGGGSVASQAAPRPKVLDKTPVLASFLLDLQYEDGGGPREPSYLIIKAAGGEWLVTMKDPTEARQIRLRVSDLGTCYAALEALLSGDTCPWEPDAWAMKSSGRTPRRKGG
jgi:hypothetical protein